MKPLLLLLPAQFLAKLTDAAHTSKLGELAWICMHCAIAVYSAANVAARALIACNANKG